FRVAQCSAARLSGPLEQRLAQVGQLRATESKLDLAPTARRQRNLHQLRVGESVLQLARCFERQRRHLARNFFACGKALRQQNGSRNGAVDVVATELTVTASALHLEHAVQELEHGDVEGAAAQIVDGKGAVLLRFQAVGD